MATALSPSLKERLRLKPDKLLINNQWVESESGKTFATFNPATGEEIAQVAEADAARCRQGRCRRAEGVRTRSVAHDVRLRTGPTDEPACGSDGEERRRACPS